MKKSSHVVKQAVHLLFRLKLLQRRSVTAYKSFRRRAAFTVFYREDFLYKFHKTARHASKATRAGAKDGTGKKLVTG